MTSNQHVALVPYRMGTLELPNRVVVAPMSRVSTQGDGVATEPMAAYYRRYAEGGFGLVVSEGTYTDARYSQGYPDQPGITNQEHVAGWSRVVQAVHDAGGRMVLQLMHAGALSQHLDAPAGPSPVQPRGTMLAGYSDNQGAFPIPKGMGQGDIDDAIEGFRSSALRACEAGFDGVEIHGANGYLLDQFLTEYTNRRDDAYGGSLANRMRLVIEVVDRVRRAVPDDFVVGLRISQGKVNDLHYLWPNGVSDGEAIFRTLAPLALDYIHFASEGAGFDAGCLTGDGQSLPRLARAISGFPVIANGGLHDPAEAARILAEGHGDLIALGTGALANPDWPKRLAEGQPIVAYDRRMLAHGVTIAAQMDWEESHQAG